MAAKPKLLPLICPGEILLEEPAVLFDASPYFIGGTGRKGAAQAAASAPLHSSLD